MSFSWVLADNCILVTTPPSSNVPFSAHMLPIRQSDLHDVSACVCMRNGRETSPVLQMWEKRREMGRTGWTKESVTPLKESSWFRFQFVSWSVVFARFEVGKCLYWCQTPCSQIISYPTAGHNTILNHSFLICLLCKGIHFVNTAISFFPSMYPWPWIFWPPHLLFSESTTASFWAPQF